MHRNRRLLLPAASVIAVVAVAAPAFAQSPDASGPASSPAASVPAGPAIEVIAGDYHFEGLPTSVPVGTTLTLDNQGAEVHELLIVRKNDGVTQSWDELLALPEEEAFAYVTMVGEMPLFAGPGAKAEGSLVLAQEGDYLAVCFIPQGLTEMPDLSASPDPSASAPAFGPPHAFLGMVQQFTVTPAGTEPGPLPSAAPMGSHGPTGSEAPASVAP